MKTLSSLSMIALIALSPAVALAGNGNSKGKNKSKLQVERVSPQSGVVRGNAGHCPPGLAKKAVPCVPPGQAKKFYRTGDRLDDYIWIDDPYRYGLRRGGNYVRAGDYVYKIDPETHKVLNLIGAVADILY
ncbi:hypothetical protein SAMN05444358_101898 [Ruegeria halocynthiae]|uniref:Regulator RcnB of Ni and Co efflux n=1 Tax=Ruegeria halocynthiae TaxID=985054 RepID=A0A1H2TRA9_9RHOB|nr:hypothetical protein [Ruegeria halocynthiae]SDW46473.1 hypothetical protein SAMN05444358_101898 [Ruegeria halocynthiae]